MRDNIITEKIFLEGEPMASFARTRFEVLRSAIVIPFVFFGGGIINKIVGLLICFAGIIAPFKLIPTLVTEPYETLTGLLLLPVGVYAVFVVIISLIAKDQQNVPILGIWWTMYALAAVEGFLFMKETAIIGTASAINALIAFPICICTVAYLPGVIISAIMEIFRK